MMSATEPNPIETASAHEPRSAAPPAFGAYAAPPPSRLREAKSGLVAAVLSLMPGLGQVYVGYYPRGFVHIAVVAGIISILSTSQAETTPVYFPLLGIFVAFFWLYNIIDAARLASLYNRALDGGREPELPEGFQMPGMGGSVVGGAVLIGASFLLLLNTRWGVRLDWVADWWPVFPMLFGAYLVGKAILERGERRRG